MTETTMNTSQNADAMATAEAALAAADTMMAIAMAERSLVTLPDGTVTDRKRYDAATAMFNSAHYDYWQAWRDYHRARGL